MNETQLDVAVVGCGPVGVTVANLLGMYGVRTAVFEKETGIFNVPRASALDDEVMRIFQSMGLAGKLLEHMSHPPGVRWLTDKGDVLAELPFREIDVHFGYPTQLFFWQPLLEQSLREGIARFDNVRVFLGREVETLKDETVDDPANGRVELGVRKLGDGSLTQVRARYVLGCDGGRSTVRHLVGLHETGVTNEHPWLVIDLAVPQPVAHLDHMHLYCDPRRPAVSYPMPLNHHRWEFMVMPGENRAELEKPEMVRQLISKYMDPAGAEIVRTAVYNFHQRVAEKWRAGNVYLLGDAAHMMPPFLGQGMSAGVRDAANLSWKLAMVLREAADERILDSYEQERRPHAQAMMAASVRNGSLIQTIRPQAAHLRDVVLKTLTRVPQVRGYLEQADPRAAPIYKAGLMAGGQPSGRHAAEGHLFIQPKVGTRAQPTVLLDEILGPGFAVLAMEADPRGKLSARSRRFWDDLQTRFVRIARGGPAAEGAPGLVECVDAEGKLAAWFQEHDAGVVVLRPDRYVFGVFPAGNLFAAEDALREAHLGP